MQAYFRNPNLSNITHEFSCAIYNIYVEGICKNQAFPEMPRQLRKTQAFTEMLRQLRKFVIFLSILQFWETAHH